MGIGGGIIAIFRMIFNAWSRSCFKPLWSIHLGNSHKQETYYRVTLQDVWCCLVRVWIERERESSDFTKFYKWQSISPFVISIFQIKQKKSFCTSSMGGNECSNRLNRSDILCLQTMYDSFKRHFPIFNDWNAQWSANLHLESRWSTECKRDMTIRFATTQKTTNWIRADLDIVKHFIMPQKDVVIIKSPQKWYIQLANYSMSTKAIWWFCLRYSPNVIQQSYKSHLNVHIFKHGVPILVIRYMKTKFSYTSNKIWGSKLLAEVSFP